MQVCPRHRAWPSSRLVANAFRWQNALFEKRAQILQRPKGGWGLAADAAALKGALRRVRQHTNGLGLAAGTAAVTRSLGHVRQASGDANASEKPILPVLRHRDDLQGLRAVAVLLVVLNHAGVTFLGGGYVGVDVFFVLSGFLITGILLGGAVKRGHVSLVDFYSRRARRILPAATLTLVVTTIVAYQLLNYVRAKQTVWDSFWASLFASNIHFAHQGADYFSQGQPPSPVQHYWSLSVEEQFYLVWPTLLSLALFGFVLGRARRRRVGGTPVITKWAVRRLLIAIVVATIASLIWSIHETSTLPAVAYFSTFARVWELGLGAALAIVALSVTRIPAAIRAALGWLGLAAIAVAAVTFSATTPFPGYAALLPTVGAALVIAAGIGDRDSRMGVGRLLAVAPMRYIGDRSYAYYLWHWPVLIIAAEYVGHDLSLGVNLLLLLAAFLLSIITFRFFEDPIRRARWTNRRSAMLVPSSVAAVVATTVVCLGLINAKVAPLEKASAAEQSRNVADGAAGRSKPNAASRHSSSQSRPSRSEDSVGADTTGIEASGR